MKTFLKILLWVAVVAVVVFLVLFVAARISGLETIPALVRYLLNQF
ncbi:MAG: hypothetical protein AB7V55_06715 [Oscillospiraceae bacterium]